MGEEVSSKELKKENVVVKLKPEHMGQLSKSVLECVVTLLSGVEDIGVLWKSIFVLNSRLMFSEFNVIRGN
jgi:hypothetical protein